MSASRKEFSPEMIAEARRLYEQTMTPIHEIAAMMGICRATLHDRIHEWKWVRRSTRQPAADFADAMRARIVSVIAAPATIKDADAALAERRVVLAARLLEMAEGQLNAIDIVLKQLGPAGKAEAERSARTLASIARSMHEIAALVRPQEMTPPHDSDDEPVPRDIDALRNELARRIHAIIDARAARTLGDGERIHEPGHPGGGG